MTDPIETMRNAYLRAIDAIYEPPTRALMEDMLDAICPPGEIVVVDRRDGTNRQLKLVETYVDWDHNYIDGSTNEIVPYDAAGLRQALYRLEPQ